MGLDHGKSFAQAKACIDAGYTGVMIDLASEDYEKNVEETRKVVALAHAKGVSVEAELGVIADAGGLWRKLPQVIQIRKWRENFTGTRE